ncbi:DUF397 domain-containing protein [Streptomyces sp. NPDC048442]|uniref:DUF397 domain-containing protein n=1 Tax=Streptomyces sp. NPDC048442 TaxID=3154823 RepID=UPI00343F87BA
MPDLDWQKSTFSEGGGGNCVNIAAAPDHPHPHTLHLRESDAPEVVLTTGTRALSALLRAVRAGA